MKKGSSKCLSVLSIILAAVISLAAPSGAVFALENNVDSGEVETVQLFNDTTNDSGLELSLNTSFAEVDDPGDAATKGDELTESDSHQEAPEVVGIDDNVSQLADTPPNKVDDDSGENVGHTGGLVISYVQVGGAAAAEELVEIYNNSYEDMDVTNWCLKYAASSQTSSFREVGCFTPDSKIGWRVILPAQSSVVFASNAFLEAAGSEFSADYVFSLSLSNSSGRLAIFDSKNDLKDAVAWGSSYVDQGDTTVQLGSKGLAFSRKFNDQLGFYVDTDNNANDFVAGVFRSGFDIGSLQDVYDACLNIEGLQVATPADWFRDEATGECSQVPPEPVNFCEGVIISEIAANTDNQFIELQNTTGRAVDLAGCHLKTNRSEDTHQFGDLKLEPKAYVTVKVPDTPLILTKTSTGTVELLSSDKSLESDRVSYNNLAKDTSWSKIDGIWKQTYQLTPDGPNSYLEYPPCESGYFRNTETGRCNKISEPETLTDCGPGRERNPETGRCRNVSTTTSALKPCKEGQYRSEETNRCRSIASAAAAALKPCADDQFRNPETNRCKKIASAEELADCGEGRERNPETNRCRNIIAASMPSAPFAPEKVTQVAQSTGGWWAFGGASILAAGYAGWQWRFEIGKFASRLRQAFSFSGQK